MSAETKTDLLDELLAGRKRNLPHEYEARIEAMYTRKLLDMCSNRFKWSGLPDSVDPRYLEITLMNYGLAVFYFDTDFFKFYALQATQDGNLDPQNNPLGFQVLGNSFVSKSLDASECVPIWNNYTRTPDTDIIRVYAHKLAKLDRTLEINADNARQPRILVVDQNTKLAMENVNRQISQGVPTIRVNTNIGEMVTALDMGVDVRGFEHISVARNREWLNCMTLLGISNANQDKKERLVANEVDANTEQTEIVKATNLNARKLAASMINERYGLAVTVSYDNDNEDEYSTIKDYSAELETQTQKHIDTLKELS